MNCSLFSNNFRKQVLRADQLNWVLFPWWKFFSNIIAIFSWYFSFFSNYYCYYFMTKTVLVLWPVIIFLNASESFLAIFPSSQFWLLMHLPTLPLCSDRIRKNSSLMLLLFLSMCWYLSFSSTFSLRLGILHFSSGEAEWDLGFWAFS